MKINEHTVNTEKSASAIRADMIRTAARILFCLMLSFALVLPLAAPAEVFASGTSSTASSEKIKYKTSKDQNINGYHVVFDSKVISNDRLKLAPGNVTTVGKKKSIKVSWGAAENTGGIDGYLILKKDINGDTWREIATATAKKTSYTDKTAKKKNKLYCYTVVAYKKVGKKKLISAPNASAGALTTKSKLKNVYAVKVSNLANVSSIMAGSCAQTYLKFPSKAYTTAITWSSSNSKVATVDANGLVTGVSPGKATIYAKTHTGSIASYNTSITKPGTAQAMIDTFTAWVGYNRINGYQNGIIDIYNSITPWPSGYKMRYKDAWCDATVSAAAIKTGNVERIGRECSVPRHIKIFQKLGIWEEDGTITPRPGDIIVYSWRKFKQPNNASASHIGLVVKVEGNQITAIEGNRGIGVVDYRTMKVGWGCIRGYARPNYAK